MKSLYLLGLCLLYVFFGQAQQIKVLEHNSNMPIPGVAIYNHSKNKSAVTDIDGLANLDIFSKDELIYFEHLLYQKIAVKKSQVIKNNGIIYLDPKVEGLDEIIVSASKFEQAKRDIPQKITSINAKTIALANPQTSADLLESSGNVFIQKSQLGGGSPMIRGLSTNRLLLSVDGVRMNNAIF